MKTTKHWEIPAKKEKAEKKPKSIKKETPKNEALEVKEPLSIPAVIEEENTPLKQEIESKEQDKGEILDKIEFSSGVNKLLIIFKKNNNRQYRIQVLLNNETEIRPVTYTGTSTGLAFWNLLKGSLKK